MKNFILTTILGAATLLPFAAKPAEAAWDAGIFLHNECHQEIYVEVHWYNDDEGYVDFWTGYIPAESYATYPDFWIWGAYDFYVYGESAHYTWSTDYVDTENYDTYNYYFTCY